MAEELTRNDVRVILDHPQIPGVVVVGHQTFRHELPGGLHEARRHMPEKVSLENDTKFSSKFSTAARSCFL